MGAPPPQKKWTSYAGAITANYVKYIDLALALFPISHGLKIVNMSSIVIYISWDGLTDEDVIDPAFTAGHVLDCFTSPTGQVWLKAASGTPNVSIAAWA